MEWKEPHDDMLGVLMFSIPQIGMMQCQLGKIRLCLFFQDGWGHLYVSSLSLDAAFVTCFLPNSCLVILSLPSQRGMWYCAVEECVKMLKSFFRLEQKETCNLPMRYLLVLVFASVECVLSTVT